MTIEARGLAPSAPMDRLSDHTWRYQELIPWHEQFLEPVWPPRGSLRKRIRDGLRSTAAGLWAALGRLAWMALFVGWWFLEFDLPLAHGTGTDPHMVQVGNAILEFFAVVFG